MDAGVPSIFAQVFGSVLSQRLHEGIPGPDNVMCCGGTPIQKHYGKDGGPLPVFSPPGTTHTCL